MCQLLIASGGGEDTKVNKICYLPSSTLELVENINIREKIKRMLTAIINIIQRTM